MLMLIQEVWLGARASTVLPGDADATGLGAIF